MVNVTRTGIVLGPDFRRVLFRPFDFGNEQRYTKIIGRIMAQSEKEAAIQARGVLADFQGRHQKVERLLLRRFDQVKNYLLTDQELSVARRILIGAYFTLEYSLESAALFNPSLVWHPDQSHLAPGEKRFIISLRAVGEGHLSSITFRSGVVRADNTVTIDEDSPYVTMAERVPNQFYEKGLFQKKLLELERYGTFAENVMIMLDDTFTLEQVKTTVALLLRQNKSRAKELQPEANDIVRLAQANYEIFYEADTNLGERVIFPYSPTESNGIEDARFVRFVEDNGTVRYYATYTAYDGRTTLPQLLETDDFLHFKITTLNGPEVQNKGMALFPRKVRGHFAMISRQDNENLYLMYSDLLHFWHTRELILKPTYPWEFVQLGNCGSPIETEQGWLVLSHGVGPMRKYSIGAFLLDRDDPSKVLGRTSEPILTPDQNEREGYVPNVVYSCGAGIHNDTLILPYAMSDRASSFATIPLADIFAAMQ